MNRIERRGRPVSDIEWNEILAKCERSLPADGDFNENENMVEEWSMNDRAFHGCVIHPRNRDRATDPVWTCRFYLAGEQRTLGRGTLYQCARLYDAAQVHYAKYRTGKPTQFNFDESQAKSDQCHADFVNFFGAVSDLFDARGIILTTAEQRVEHSRLRTLDRQHDTRTATGRIETRLTALEKSQENLHATLARIETRLNTIAVQLALQPVVVVPATAESLVDAKNNLVPIQTLDLTLSEPAVSCTSQ